jgi:hypothetical protein
MPEHSVAHERGQGNSQSALSQYWGRKWKPYCGVPSSIQLGAWAEMVVRKLFSTWPARWPQSPKAVFKAGRGVDDRVGLNERGDRPRADPACARWVQRYAELTDSPRGDAK